MSALSLVIVMLVAITASIVAVLTTVAVSSFIQSHRLRYEPSLTGARQAIIDTLSGNDPHAAESFGRLGRRSERYLVNVMLDLAPSFNGTSRSLLVPLGEQIGILQRAHQGLRSRRWAIRLYSARVLTAFGIESDELYTLFVDRSSEVRAQAAVWSVVAPSPRAIEHLIHLLDDADGQCRFAAQDALIRIGRPSCDAIVDALGTSSGEGVRRLLRVAAAMGDERIYPRAAALTMDSAPQTRALAAAVLARTGTRAAGPMLIGLLGDPSDDVVLAAATGLAKLAFWPGAARVEELLSDPSWSLRKQASLTLLAFGAPGTILLRANAPGTGTAADMAMQALELESLVHRTQAA